MQIRVEVCDLGGLDEKDKPVQTYRVGKPGDRLRSIALCVDHAKPLVYLVADLDRAHPTATPRRARRPFADMSDVQAARKRATRKKPE